MPTNRVLSRVFAAPLMFALIRLLFYCVDEKATMALCCQRRQLHLAQRCCCVGEPVLLSCITITRVQCTRSVRGVILTKEEKWQVSELFAESL